MTVILDASALLAVLLVEPGRENVEPHLMDAVISTVNLSEVFARALKAGVSADDTHWVLEGFDLTTISFSAEQAIETALLLPVTRHLGLSLGDRACLALAMETGFPVLTADRQWEGLDVGIDIRLIR